MSRVPIRLLWVGTPAGLRQTMICGSSYMMRLLVSWFILVLLVFLTFPQVATKLIII